MRPVDADESARPGEAPETYVCRVAALKASAIGQPPAESLVLGADTVVVVDGQRLGKPADRADAADMLRRLSGKTHDVWTGIALVHPGGCINEAVRTRVTFQTLPPDVIEWYVASGEPDDKAGAYAIQGLGSRFIEQIAGSYSNVVGLPVERICTHLRRLAPRLLVPEKTAGLEPRV